MNTYPDNLEGDKFFVLHHPDYRNFLRHCWDGERFSEEIEDWLMFQESDIFEAEIIALSAINVEVQPAILEITQANNDQCLFSLSFVEKVNEFDDE